MKKQQKSCYGGGSGGAGGHYNWRNFIKVLQHHDGWEQLDSNEMNFT